MKEYYPFIMRFIICFILSAIIGIEREFNNKVGLKINMLVSIGTYLFCSIAFSYDGEEEARILAQIISGIGFLGAGSIVTNDNEIKGLTTAATIWCVTAISILVSLGYVIEALVGTFTVLFINLIFKNNFFNDRALDNFYLKIKCRNDFDIKNILFPIEKNLISTNEKKYKFNKRYKIIFLKLQNINRDEIENFIKQNQANTYIRNMTYGQF